MDQWHVNPYRRDKLPEEHCVVCDAPTGRAGRHDDSIYCNDCDAGPLCDECATTDFDEWVCLDCARKFYGYGGVT